VKVYDCVVCGLPITDGVMWGMGDGTGERFGHDRCYWRTEARKLEDRLILLRDDVQFVSRLLDRVAIRLDELFPNDPKPVMQDDLRTVARYLRSGTDRFEVNRIAERAGIRPLTEWPRDLR
jgi:hypothetical protein